MDIRYLKIMTVRAGLSARSSMTSRNGTYTTDTAGNRVADREQYPALPAMWRDNRIGEDVQYFYHHDAHGRLVEKDERRIRDGGGYVHHYHYDNRHRLVHYRRKQQGITLLESRYLYDPPGRRIGKRVWKSRCEHGSLSGEEYIYLDKTPEVTWYGWDGDRLTTTETATQRVQTIYTPGSFTPLVRIETETSELAKAVRRTLAEKFQQEANVTFPPELVALVDNLEAELQRGELSEANRAWLAQCGLTPEQIQNQMEPEYTPERKIHLYHCDHRGLPLALIDVKGRIAWRAEFDEWGNMLRENNPDNLQQLIRLPGQQYDEESGLHYNRHRYYDLGQGRYITQDPIGLMGGWNFYSYPENPIGWIDPMGLAPRSGYRRLNNGGYGARPAKKPMPDPGKLPDIAEQLKPKYPIDQASSDPNVFKTFFRALSPYDYTLYCRKWVKPNLTCTPRDDPRYPGMDTKTASDYLPQKRWATDQLPEGYICAEPYLFSDLDEFGGPATAGIDDWAELGIRGVQRIMRGARK